MYKAAEEELLQVIENYYWFCNRERLQKKETSVPRLNYETQWLLSFLKLTGATTSSRWLLFFDTNIECRS